MASASETLLPANARSSLGGNEGSNSTGDDVGTIPAAAPGLSADTEHKDTLLAATADAVSPESVGATSDTQKLIVRSSRAYSEDSTGNSRESLVVLSSEFEPLEIQSPEFDGDREHAKQPERRAEWYMIVFLLLGDIIGTGVLELPVAVRKLGYVTGTVAIVFCALPNLYTGLLLVRLRNAYPRAVSYRDMAHEVLGPRWGLWVGALMYFSFAILLASYLLVLAKTLQGLFWKLPTVCQPVWAAVAALALVPSNQLRTLNAVSITTVVGCITMIITLVVCVLEALQRAKLAAPVGVVPHNSDSSGWRYFEAFSGIVFAFSGQAIYLEMMAEMKEPKKFSTSLVVSTMSLTSVYLVVALTIYAALGTMTPAFLPALLADDWRRTLAMLALFVHMVVSYTITQQILSRAIVLMLAPGLANDYSRSGRTLWFGVTSSLLAFSFLVANSIPYFDDLTGICGSLLNAPISFILPCVFYLAATKSRDSTARSEVRRNPLVAVSRSERCILLTLIITAALFGVFGLVSNLKDAVEKTEATGAFACRCLSC